MGVFAVVVVVAALVFLIVRISIWVSFSRPLTEYEIHLLSMKRKEQFMFMPSCFFAQHNSQGHKGVKEASGIVYLYGEAPKQHQ